MNNPEVAKRSHRNTKTKRVYGLTLDEIVSRLETQGGKCAVRNCPNMLSFTAADKRNKPHVDHCHKTGVVRGLLCLTCNTGIGMFGDNPVLLADAIDYLEIAGHRERLSEEAPEMGDAIVCSHGNENHERSAEMTGPAIQ